MIIAPSNEKTALINVIADYCQGRKGPTLGGVRAQSYDEGKAEGWRNGVAETLGVWLSVKRRDELKHSQWVELIGWYEVRETLQPFVDRFHEARNAPKPKDKEVVSEFDMFLMAAYDALMGIVVTAEQRKLDDEQRREKILKGEAEPTEADRSWLEERLAESQATVEQVKSLMGHVEVKG